MQLEILLRIDVSYKEIKSFHHYMQRNTKVVYAIKNMRLGIHLKSDVPYEEIKSYH